MLGRLPKADAQEIGVRPGEKVIAWGRVGGDDSDVVVATDHALYVDATHRLLWTEISRASWDEPILTLSIVTNGRTSPMRVRIENARDLPRAVNAKVTESVVVSERMELDGGVIAQFVARRDGDAISWSVVFEAGADPKDPVLRASADRALRELRDALGI